MPEAQETSQSDPASAGMWSRFGVASAALGGLALVAFVLIALMWVSHRAEDGERRQQARAMAAAADWTAVLININADNVGSRLEQLRDGTVGELNTGFDSSIAPYRDVVKTLRSRTSGQVESVSIEALHNRLGAGPGQPPPAAPTLAPELSSRTDTVLVVATSVSENVGGKPTTVRWNLRLGVSEVDGKPMISRLESVR